MRKKLSFIVLLTIGALIRLDAQREVLIYDLYANKVKMGRWEISKTVEGDHTIYESRREVVFKFLKTHRTETFWRAIYLRDTLQEANVEVVINGESRRNFKTFRSGSDFFHREDEKPARQLEKPVAFSDLELFFGMPEEVASVYVSREGAFLPLERSDHNSYVVTLTNGEQNQYHYFDGYLTRATLEEGILHTYLRLRKQKEQRTVGR
jgi:hypothetical protein